MGLFDQLGVKPIDTKRLMEKRQKEFTGVSHEDFKKKMAKHMKPHESYIARKHQHNINNAIRHGR